MLNLVGIVVGVNALRYRNADAGGLAFSLFWAALYVLLLARIIAEAVSEPRTIKARLERRKAGAMLARRLPWPDRVNDVDEEIDLTVEHAAAPRAGGLTAAHQTPPG